MSVVVPVVPVVHAYKIIVVIINIMFAQSVTTTIILAINSKVKVVILGENTTCSFH